MSSPRGSARARVIAGAEDLFAEHGVRATSLRMIADRIGVGKAAVYYQFASKQDIVLAVLRPQFDELADLVANASREDAVTGLVESIVRRRHASFPFRGDRYIDELVRLDAELRTVRDGLFTLLLGPDPDHGARVSLTTAIAGIYYCATDPTLNDIAAPELGAAMVECFTQCVAGFSWPGRPAANPPRPTVTQPDAALRDWAPWR